MAEIYSIRKGRDSMIDIIKHGELALAQIAQIEVRFQHIDMPEEARRVVLQQLAEKRASVERKHQHNLSIINCQRIEHDEPAL